MTNTNDGNRQWGSRQPEGVAPRISDPDEIPMPAGILGKPFTATPHSVDRGVAPRAGISPALRAALPKLGGEKSQRVRDVVKRK